MDRVNWIVFMNLLPFMVFGLVIHLLKQLRKAKGRNDYSWARFKQLNGLGYIIATITCSVLLMMLSAGISIMPGFDEIFVSFTIGVSGGSLLRKIGGRS